MRAFPVRLLAWYDRNKRALPWRETRDPWAIWVSEVMLQQTRVEAVRLSYVRFMARYPDPSTFAEVSDDELLAAWKGLGYYRRARLLRDGARAVMERHDGAVPSEPDALAALPGVGAYTCGAVASIAFDRALPAIDGNAERVIARHLAIREPVKTGVGRRAVREAIESMLPQRRPGDFNQALMELGATVCTPRNPRCDACPVGTDCAAATQGLIESLPVLPKRRESIEVHARAVLVLGSDGSVIGHRVPDGDINAGQIDLPGPGPLLPCSGPDELTAALWTRFGTRFIVGDEIGRIRHGITHHRITLVTHRAELRNPAKPEPLLVAADPEDATTPWTTLARKVFALVRRAEGETAGEGSGSA